MKRRTLIKSIPFGLLAAAGGVTLLNRNNTPEISTGFSGSSTYDKSINLESLFEENLYVKDSIKSRPASPEISEDIILTGKDLEQLKSIVRHLERVQKRVGYANFNLLGFDEMLRTGRDFSSVGKFTRNELDFIESIYTTDARKYGFFGDKVAQSMTEVVSRKDTSKISRTGHFLFKGESMKMYDRVCKDLHDTVVLTSGIRGVVKQTYLFLSKGLQLDGNLSQASYSLAPPGHSYHGVGDFDVGKVGFGYRNFTADFAQTDEYKRLIDLGYVLIRYTDKNPYGVRFEPWHIKVV